MTNRGSSPPVSVGGFDSGSNTTPDGDVVSTREVMPKKGTRFLK
jgi:hypothetical protein